MDAISVDEAVIFEDSFQNMKVTELKKELKARGLPMSGTKQELLERLQSAESTLKDSKAETEIEDEILNDSLELLESPPPAEVKPLKKRTIVSDTDPATATVEKKVSLNRSNTIPVPPTTPVEDADEEALKNSNVDVSKKNVSSMKTMTPQEKLAMRAQRFNVVASSGVTALSAPLNKNGSTLSKMSAGMKAPDLDVLRKRAERFGGNVSTVMKQLEAKEKVLKRKMRFGASALPSLGVSDEIEQKKIRAERFGL